ncbi:spore coat putative kinase YutH [Metabacillus fastidiosus]|uniref:spore coat putative kinase YutH n=1 Tax=Metabacillus fastidiosus TaxID=1458 RepID=UPI002E2108A3|nr:spore coat protein YutH [Metabacillus fastidiosus]MED4533860.1 spore coat protein YutH [Metabacillus fastidiosus]
MKKMIQEHYGLKAIDLFKVNGCDAFQLHQTIFLLQRVQHLSEEELYEIYQMGQFLQDKREPCVGTFVLTKDNNLFFENEKVKYILLKCRTVKARNETQLGSDLARFHQKARSFPYELSNISRIGQWKYLWEKRLDQLEGFWRGKLQSYPLNHFEKQFVESFPYYLGLAENAIQYLVDTELDDEPQSVDAGTICHQRFNLHTWNNDMYIKMPTDWVFDHCGRDIAEYLRYLFFSDETNSSYYTFINEYDRTTPLSAFSWRLIYSRLLFPLHYFECIEGYYLSPEGARASYEKELTDLLNESDKYEQFLRGYFGTLSMRTKKIFLPRLHWLNF